MQASEQSYKINITHPVYCILTQDDENGVAYGDVKKFGEAMEIGITPSVSAGELYGEDKLDEISGSAETFVAELKADGTITTYEIKPEDFGFARGTKDQISGGTPAENAEVTRGILEGKITDIRRDVVCMNAGAALYAAGKAKTIEEGVGLAKHLIESGKALETLNKFVEESNK